MADRYTWANAIPLADEVGRLVDTAVGAMRLADTLELGGGRCLHRPMQSADAVGQISRALCDWPI